MSSFIARPTSFWAVNPFSAITARNVALDLGVGEALRQVALEDGELLGLGVDEVLAAALGVLLDRVLALLDGAPQDGLDLLVRSARAGPGSSRSSSAASSSRSVATRRLSPLFMAAFRSPSSRASMRGAYPSASEGVKRREPRGARFVRFDRLTPYAPAVKRFLVGTAGHIDHGKTALVKALTGIDADRLPEEKRRGITIDLGFAHAEWEGARVSFVDVPGHERFVRNMLAGAGGIEAVLLVVAADESVMPQTREHFEIVRMLGPLARASSP